MSQQSIDTAPLTNDQLDSAMNAKYKTWFPERNTVRCDPDIPSQVYCLHTFVPVKGATPNEHGVYGVMKVRGVYRTEEEARKRAEHLVKHYDSFYNIRTSYVGAPFPLCGNECKYIKDDQVDEVELGKATKEAVTDDIKERRRKEKDEIKEMEDRQKRLLEDVKQEELDPFETYTMLHTKRAQSIWTMREAFEKLCKVRKVVLDAERDIARMDTESDEYREDFTERYYKARREAHLPDDDGSFLQYFGSDVKLSDIEAIYTQSQ
jgi:hypothetical protein